MKPTKAYILKIDTSLSTEYAKVCSDSCDSIGLSWEYVEGYYKMSGKAAWSMTGIKLKYNETYKHIEKPSTSQKAECCSAGHGRIWKLIAEGSDDVAVVLEHDAMVLQPIDIDIPDDTIVVLGYKIDHPSNYDHISAGPPRELLDITGHEGAHAYAITKKTAQKLINELEKKGSPFGNVDNAYFIRKQRKTKLPLKIVSPTPVIAWIRESTIWNKAANRNYEFIPSFKSNLKNNK